MTAHPHRIAARSVLFVLAALLTTAPGTVRGQDAPQPPTEERLEQFARAHIAINEARDEFHGEIARVHDEEGRRRAREAVDERIAEILAENEMTQEEYDDFILRISLDGELRAAFEETVARLQEEPS